MLALLKTSKKISNVDNLRENITLLVIILANIPKMHEITRTAYNFFAINKIFKLAKTII